MSEVIIGKFYYFSIASLMILPILTWERLFRTYRKLQNDYNNDRLFFKRHNCVVMYSKSRGMNGWPPYEELQLTIDSVNKFIEPFLYFINTATTSLNIAIMALDIKSVIEALIKAKKRGVQIRIILNFESVKSRKDLIYKLHQSGVKVIFYVSTEPGLSSLMHYKYMVKDWKDSKGFVCMGSANLTSQTSFLNNFEDVVFSSKTELVEVFQKDFENCWSYICKDNKSDYKRAILEEAHLPQQ